MQDSDSNAEGLTSFIHSDARDAVESIGQGYCPCRDMFICDVLYNV